METLLPQIINSEIDVRKEFPLLVDREIEYIKEQKKEQNLGLTGTDHYVIRA